MIILSDMDGVVADFDKGVLNIYRERYPDKPFVSLDQRKSFYVKDDYLPELQPLVEEIYLSKGFFRGLAPIEGSIEALLDLEASGADVYICTSPLLSNSYCIQEKYDWVIEKLGKNWADKMIVTKDKTIVRGDYLFDDKPKVSGSQVPTWEHILYSQPYNKEVKTKRRITWQNWKSVFN